MLVKIRREIAYVGIKHIGFKRDGGPINFRIVFHNLAKVMTLMDASPNKDSFERMLNRALPKYGATKEMFEE